MRPRYLELEGLQSFKDKQAIDFDRLGETGLFGIFGPTGSGKSTVLDAMTLALYGSVKRAGRGIRGTQGIINTDRDEVKVGFTFDLLKDGIRKGYRVERVYRRKKDSDTSVENRLTRLIEIADTGQEIVTADKLGDVNKKIEQLIGLEPDDFTRSVVLPQNSFQEFLLLGGAERRKMLERIFYLQEYGRQLTERVTGRLNAAKTDLARVKGAMSSLGDVSRDTLREAEKKVEETLELKNKTDSQLELMEKEHNAAKEIWDLQVELDQINREQQKLLEKQPLAEQKRRRYSQAQRAKELGTAIAKYNQLQNDMQDTLVQLEKTCDKLALLERELERTTRQYNDHREEVRHQRPRLMERASRLKDALVLEDEISDMDKQLARLRRQYDDLKKAADEKQKGIESCRLQLEDTDRAMEDIRKKMDRLRNRPQGSREAIMRDIQRLHRLQLKCQALGTQAAAIDVLEEKHRALMDTMEEHRGKLTALQSQSRDLLQRLEGHRQRLKGLEQQYKNNTAYILAKDLGESQACPVCGSKHHPMPAVQPEGANIEDMERQLEETRAKFETTDKLHRELQKKCIVMQEQLRAAAAQRLQLSKELDKARDSYRQTQGQLPETMQGLDTESLRQKLEIMETDHRKQLTELEKWQQQIEGLRQKERQLRDAQQGLYQQKHRLDSRLSVIQAEGKGIRTQKEKQQNKLKELAGDKSIDSAINAVEGQLEQLDAHEKQLQSKVKQLETQHNRTAGQKGTLENQRLIYQRSLDTEKESLQDSLRDKGFENIDQAQWALLSEEECKALNEWIEQYDDRLADVKARKEVCLKKLKERSLTQEEWDQINRQYRHKRMQRDTAISQYEQAKLNYSRLKDNYDQWRKLNKEYTAQERKTEMLEQIQSLLRGNSFVEFISEERLKYVAGEASETLGLLTKYRYALELDTGQGFVIRDYANGGVLRAVSTLSGGETFLASLSLALALSKQIQLKGQSPLEFFFLDEGFGTLDHNLLDGVIDALERLGSKQMVIGVISHVPELKNRIARRLIVEPPSVYGEGSRVRLEK